VLHKIKVTSLCGVRTTDLFALRPRYDTRLTHTLFTRRICSKAGLSSTSPTRRFNKRCSSSRVNSERRLRGWGCEYGRWGNGEGEQKGGKEGWFQTTLCTIGSLVTWLRLVGGVDMPFLLGDDGLLSAAAGGEDTRRKPVFLPLAVTLAAHHEYA
jgi:hypothetical protein